MFSRLVHSWAYCLPLSSILEWKSHFSCVPGLLTSLSCIAISFHNACPLLVDPSHMPSFHHPITMQNIMLSSSHKWCRNYLIALYGLSLVCTCMHVCTYVNLPTIYVYGLSDQWDASHWLSLSPGPRLVLLPVGISFYPILQQVTPALLCLTLIAHQIPYHPFLFQQLSYVYDVYLKIVLEVNCHLQVTLNHNSQEWWLRNECLACFYHLEYSDEPMLSFDWLVSIDGNNSLKQWDTFVYGVLPREDHH